MHTSTTEPKHINEIMRDMFRNAPTPGERWNASAHARNKEMRKINLMLETEFKPIKAERVE